MPSSVKIIVRVANQRRTNKVNNTILVAVCPPNRDEYDEVSKLLGELLIRVLELVRDGVVVDGGSRAVRLLLTSDYEALCKFHAHKGSSATMPCLMCYATNTPSLTHSGLDSIYNTRHDVDLLSTTPLRKSSHSEEIVVASDPQVGPGEHMANLPHAVHRSIERLPLLCINHLQIAPIPLHSTMEGSPRSLWFAAELIVSCRGRAAG